MNQISKRIMGISYILAVILSGCGSSPRELSVMDVWARPGIAGGNSAVFFVIENPLESDDRLLAAYSDVADAVELHKTSMVDGKMKMEMQDYVMVAAGSSLDFKPGDFHVMLIGLRDDLAVGDQFELTLAFVSAGEKIIEVVVKEP